ncbi:TPA: hypothetical protein ACPZ0W_000055 [Enterobacter bugandensis]|uniref:hypothetical protein n=1 Tax=Enterobacter TaxID=547 RepID=UPI0005EC2E28|nr:hypothetical protein [Enterobacter bugandensis]KJN35379.1 hypothetical protein SS14_03040 [Enterobacter bugandensis]MCK1123662.1 hypothetical protein [Enterobacter bugandensis]HAS1311008.1 hypothetical protein [Enterobacter bugandensis]HBM7586680.1 hypothetical protein [Enterobacter bugandensis]HBM7620495.1 hypothetical protein [Enterobacter bugandensis]
MKWPYVIKMPAIGKSRGKNDGQYSITVGGFLNVDPFIVAEFAVFVYKSCATARFAIVLFNFTTNE